MMNACTKPLNFSRAASRRIDYYDKKGDPTKTVHMVLADLCLQLEYVDASNDLEGDDGGELESNKDIFETLMNSQQSSIRYGGLESDCESPEHYSEEDAVFDSSCAPCCESSKDECDGGVVCPDDGVTGFNILLSTPRKAPVKFEGACIDTGAQRSVIGSAQGHAYCRFMNIPYAIEPPKRLRTFRFADKCYRGLGYLEIRLPVNDAHFIQLSIDVVDINVPLLVGLDLMEAFQMTIDTNECKLISKSELWSLPLLRNMDICTSSLLNLIFYSQPRS